MMRHRKTSPVGLALGIGIAACCCVPVAAETPAKPDAAQSTSVQPDEARTDRIRIEYVAPKNPAHQKVYDLVKEHRALETLQEIVDRMPGGPTPAGFSPSDTVIGQFFYAAAHELGHASFDLLDVPVFGGEEDAADQFATYIMLQFGQERARRLIGGAAYSYSAFVKGRENKPDVTLPLLAFSSNHGPPEQRFYNMLCIAYGSDELCR